MILPNGKTTRRWLATVIVILAIVFGLWFNQDRGLKRVARETHASLCALRQDIERRHQAGVEYLKGHPRGLVGDTGVILISAAQISDSISNQESTLSALDPLNC